MKRKTQRVTWRRIDLKNNHDDKRCGIMIMQGLSNKAIFHATGLTPWRISSRAKKLETNRREIRDGTPKWVKEMNQATEYIAESHLLQIIGGHYKQYARPPRPSR